MLYNSYNADTISYVIVVIAVIAACFIITASIS